MRKVALDPKASARCAQLVYVNDGAPGYYRHRSGKGFRYVNSEGKAVRSDSTLNRIRSLVLPPAWKEVWICRSGKGHLQATGIDARGRKQYRYHPKWSLVRDQTKHEKVLQFAEKLPHIRRRVGRDLKAEGLPKRKVLALVVRLLEASLIRVGNEEYARENHSFGLTTFKSRHAAIRGSHLTFHFKGKSGVEHHIDLNDKRLAELVRRCQCLPGQDLFQYRDENGQRHPISSSDVNAYIHEIAGEEFTAKDFRTWAGTVLAARALREVGAFGSQAEAKKNVVKAIESVARRLGNTKAVCRKCYIHPMILSTYLDGTLIRHRAKTKEAHVLAFLHKHLKRAAGGRRLGG